MYTKMRVIVLLLSVTIVHSIKDDWTDPHEIKFSNPGKLKRSNSENDKDKIGRISAKNELNEAAVDENASLLFLKRTINLILNSASPEKGDSSLHSGSYRFRIDSEVYNALKEFSEKELVNSNDMRRLDSALSELFKNNDYEFINLDVSKLNYFFEIDFILLLMTPLCLFVMFYLIKNKFGFLNIFLYAVFSVFVVDYAKRYQFMLEEASEHNIHMEYSKECDTNKMNWKQYIAFLLEKKSCERKIVTPLDVMLNQLKYAIIIPFESFGTGIGGFSSELWSKLPFPWNLIMFPLMLLFVMLMILFIMIVLLGAPFKLNILHLFCFQFGNTHDGQDRVSARTLDRLLNFTWAHRPMVEPAISYPNNEPSPERSPSRNRIREKESCANCANKNKTSIEVIEEEEISPEQRGISCKNKKENLEFIPKERKDLVEDANIDSNLNDCTTKKEN